jgi:hypothetical protein
LTDEIEVVAVEPESPHNAALYEAGKTLLIESVQVGREFCKFMVGIATGAIPTYLALVGLAVGKDYSPSNAEGILLLVAPTLFLAAAGVFAFGCFPVSGTLSLDIPSEIESARTAATDRRRKCALIGFTLFGVGVACAVAGATYALAIEVSPPAALRSG